MRAVKVTSKVIVSIIASVVLFDVWRKGVHEYRQNYGTVFINKNLTRVVVTDATTKSPSTVPIIDTQGTTSPINDSDIENESLSEDDMIDVPIPLQVLRKYQEQHSDTVLWKEYNSTMQGSLQTDYTAATNDINKRRFAIAYYSCPRRVGNFLHYFFNAVTWSMIHNRTVLWKFFRLHEKSSTVDECEAILQRAKWIPSYDEWKERLNMPPPVNVPLRRDATYNKSEHQQLQQLFDHVHLVLFPQFPDGLYPSSVQKNMTRHGWADHPMKRDDSIEYIKSLPQPMQDTARDLYTYGPDFLYGMLYSELFTLQFHPSENVLHLAANDGISSTTLTNGNKGTLQKDKNDSKQLKHLRVALHSRHTVSEDDGSYIRDEINCLTKILPTREQQMTQNIPCSIYLMSDRQNTIENITQWIVERYIGGDGPDCNVITANHSISMALSASLTISNREEHGPWSGVGFFQDLDVVANAEHVLIGDIHRSSTKLLLEVLEYRRILSTTVRPKIIGVEEQHGDTHRSSNLPRLVKCQLPVRSASLGYNYGPGTPTFQLSSI